jgi:hypothetical protein
VIVYEIEDGDDRVDIVTVQDGRSSHAATAPRYRSVPLGASQRIGCRVTSWIRSK